MYSFLHSLLSDKKDGVLFSCFGLWHVGYILLAVVIGTLTLLYLKNKSYAQKDKTAKLFVDLSFYVLISDFFFMPLAYGEIDIEKLPFHICTAMCVMCFLSRRVGFLREYTLSFAMLGFLSNLGYLLYPAGLMWHATHPLSYRVVETLLFHGLMSVYGLLVIVKEYKKLEFKKCYRDLGVIACMTLWAMLGNYTYNGDYSGETKFFNWFFVVRDPFYILPENIAPFVMPVLNVLMFFTAEMIIYLIAYVLKRRKGEHYGF